MILNRLGKAFFSNASLAETLTGRMKLLRKEIVQQEELITHLKSKVNQDQKNINFRTNVLTEKRLKLTEDVRKSENIWAEAKKKSQANKANAIHSFAVDLIDLSNHFTDIKTFEKETHQEDLREGFQNTSRLFISILAKFNIKQKQLKVGEKYKKSEEIIVAKQQKAEKEDQKGTIASILENGWEVEKKLVRPSKVVVYI